MLAPAVHTLPRSAYSDGDRARAIVSAIGHARDIDSAIPVVYGGRVIGATYGLRGTPLVKFLPLTHRQWCGFKTYGELQSAVLKGQIITTVSFKVYNGNTAWNDLWPVANGIPQSGDYSGAAATARQCNDTTIGGIQNHFVPGGAKTAHIYRYQFGNNTNALQTFCLYDRVLTYDKEVIALLSTVMTNTLPAQRYISAGQPGLLILVTGTTGLALGAVAATLTTLTYVDDDGNPGQTVPTDTALNWGVSSTAATGVIAAPIVLPRTNLLTYSPFLPLAPGDTGVRSITDYQSSAINTGQICMALVRPLGWLINGGASNTTRVDPGRDVMALDRLYDGACLSLMVRGTVNATQMVNAYFAWN